MKQQLIQSLLDKYFEGETTLEELDELKALLREEPLTEEQQAFRTWFNLLEAEQNQHLGADFDAKIMQAIAQNNPPKVTPIRVRWVQWIPRVAAVVAILAAGLWYLTQTNLHTPEADLAEVKVIDWSKYEPKTPEEAYRVTRDAFRRVSEGLNEGTSIASEGLSQMQEMGERIK